MKKLFTLAAALVLSTVGSRAMAQHYPSHPVTIICPIAAGGTDDLIARLVAQYLTQEFGQTFIVDNRPGAGNTLGSAMVARAAPDGYTLLLADVSNTISASLYSHLPYDSATAFSQVAFLASTPYILVTNPKLGVTDVKGLVAMAQASPGKLTYASAGQGTGSHLAAALFAMQAKVNMIHVPYKGGSPALNDVLGGHVDTLFVAAPSAISIVKSGRLLGLMSSDAKARTPSFPNAPTSKEAGLPNYSLYDWFGLSAPRGTPKDVVLALNRAVNKVLARADVRQKLAEQALQPIPMTPQAYTEFFNQDMKRWGSIVHATNTHVD